MSVIDPAANERFKITIFKYLSTNPNEEWVNTYECRAGIATTNAQLITLAQNLWNMERDLHLPQVTFDRAVISSWLPDGDPYNPDSFVSLPIGLPGLRSSSGDLEPIQMVLFVRREVESGRYGKLFYRNVLTEGDVVTTAGFPHLNAPSAMNDLLQLAITDNDLTEEFTTDTTLLRITMESTASSRSVTGLTVVGVRFNQVNHRYFDVP